MPICPNCRMEYRPDIARCPDCDADLVESLPEPEESLPQEDLEGLELVELAVFSNSAEAEMIRELLEDNGIRTVLRGDVDPIGVASGATPSTLLVEQADYEEARRYYEDFFGGQTAADSEPPPEE